MLAALATTLVSATGHLAHAATYYISSAIGSDNNTARQAQQEATPWAHLPGMVDCTDSCASYDPQPGDHFILRGGDTWGASSLGVGWSWSGTASSPITIGVDPKWHSGSAWTRPIWSCGGATCAGGGNMWTSCNDYVTLDNIEMKGLFQATDGGIAYVEACGKHQTYEHLYIHGWSHGPGATSDDLQAFGGNGGYDVTGDTYHDNVIDGSDTTKDSLVAFFNSIPIAYDNFVQYVTNGFEAAGNSWHDNTVQHLVPCFTGSCHQNFMFHFHPYSGNKAYLYNNVLAHATWANSGGAPKLWLEGLGTCSGCTTYVFNNVVYDQQEGNYLNIADHPAGDYGTFYLYNNTFEVGRDGSVGAWDGSTDGSHLWTMTLANNHWIASGVTCGTGCTETNDIIQSVATAKAQGYADAPVAFAFSPVSASGATVRAGKNLSSFCTGEVSALCDDTTYGVGYDTARHTVVAPARTAIARPAGGVWDVGAYQCVPTGDGGCAKQAPPAPDGGAGSGGTAGTGGAAPTGGAGTGGGFAATSGNSTDKGGCSCRTAEDGTDSGAALALLLTGAVLISVRRR